MNKKPRLSPGLIVFYIRFLPYQPLPGIE